MTAQQSWPRSTDMSIHHQRSELKVHTFIWASAGEQHHTAILTYFVGSFGFPHLLWKQNCSWILFFMLYVDVCALEVLVQLCSLLLDCVVFGSAMRRAVLWLQSHSAWNAKKKKNQPFITPPPTAHSLKAPRHWKKEKYDPIAEHTHTYMGEWRHGSGEGVGDPKHTHIIHVHTQRHTLWF